MKNIFTLIILSLSILTFAQKKVWPQLDYTYAKAYLYNLESGLHGNYQIIKEGQIDGTATDKGVLLSKNQLKRVIQLSNLDIRGLVEGLSSCFIPHHGIVFYDKLDKPIASIMLGFYCEGIRFSPGNEQVKIEKELSDHEIKEQQSILTEYEKIIRELGFLVFESPSAYKNYSKLLKRKQGHPLKLIGRTGVKQLNSVDNQRFDLSGIAKYQNDIFVVADKEWNNRIYSVDTNYNSFSIKPVLPVCPNTKIDFEGIDVCEDEIYLIEEWYDNVYQLNTDSCNLNKLALRWEHFGIYRSGWGNRGLEGIAVDCNNEIMYLAKEREPRRIFEIDMKSGKISEPFKNVLGPQKAGYDISDMKFENGYLYILERGIGQVSRIHVETKELLSYSYQDVVKKDGNRIFKNFNPEYGMAEALLLTKDQIWVGIDNNGDPVSLYGKTMGLKENNNTIILIFERPKGF